MGMIASFRFSHLLPNASSEWYVLCDAETKYIQASCSATRHSSGRVTLKTGSKRSTKRSESGATQDAETSSEISKSHAQSRVLISRLLFLSQTEIR